MGLQGREGKKKLRCAWALQEHARYHKRFPRVFYKKLAVVGNRYYSFDDQTEFQIGKVTEQLLALPNTVMVDFSREKIILTEDDLKRYVGGGGGGGGGSKKERVAVQ